MKSDIKQFPRSFRSSSAAYRAIRQYDEKLTAPSGLTMTKVDSKTFIVAKSGKLTQTEFNEKLPNVKYPGNSEYRYFPDGLVGAGYYELKTGNRRRPNSLFLDVERVYTDLLNDVCE